MTIKQYLILMSVCTVLCWCGFLMVVFFINPEATSGLGFVLFYFSLFFAVAGILAIGSYLCRLFFTRFYSKKESVQVSFRQAVFLALVFTLGLFLQAHHLMTWLNTVLLVLLITLIEFLILSLKKNPIAS